MYLTKLILSWWQGTIHRLVYGEALLVRSKIAPMRLTILPDSIEPFFLNLRLTHFCLYNCFLLLYYLFCFLLFRNFLWFLLLVIFLNRLTLGFRLLLLLGLFILWFRWLFLLSLFELYLLLILFFHWCCLFNMIFLFSCTSGRFSFLHRFRLCLLWWRSFILFLFNY